MMEQSRFGDLLRIEIQYYNKQLATLTSLAINSHKLRDLAHLFDQGILLRNENKQSL